MTRQALVASLMTVVGCAGVGIWSLSVEQQPTTIGLSFDPIDPAAGVEFARYAGGSLTREDLVRIESGARHELRNAFAATCLQIVDSPAARYHVRVHQDLVGLVAGESRSMPGLRGSGSISFASIEAGAVAFAPTGADRSELVAAIGRGIGRTAAHELAHQLLGGFQLHDTRDRSSYEYPDLRPEHFYGNVHWTIAAAPLQARFGRGRNACP